jgi:hypothetical protein
MGNACCDTLGDHQEFRAYCMEAAGNDYKPYISKVKSGKVLGD